MASALSQNLSEEESGQPDSELNSTEVTCKDESDCTDNKSIKLLLIYLARSFISIGALSTFDVPNALLENQLGHSVQNMCPVL